MTSEELSKIIKSHKKEIAYGLPMEKYMDEIFCKHCQSNNWEMVFNHKGFNNHQYNIEIAGDKLHCCNCNKEIPAKDIRTKAQLRDDRLNSLIDNS